MKPRISVLTLGVDDLARAVSFYRDGLGLATEGIIGTEFEHGAVAFFDLNPGLKLALWARPDIAHDTALPKGLRSPTEFTIGHNVASAAEVDAVMAQALKAGATTLKATGKTFYGGYAGYFQDLDGHVWEIAFNPGFPSPDEA
jgi:catechol 2,3-dioxygenase-like lactoylglutathione lyase family enzyme